jgi:hypothetical protein
MFAQVALFAQANPSVYASEANLSNLSIQEILEQPWVWILVGCVFIIAAFALFAARTTEHHEAAH